MADPFDLTAGWLEGHVVVPLLYRLGWMQWEDISFGWALFAVYGAVQVVLTFAVCMPLERWRPVERWPDSKAVWVDVLYTLLSRVGVLPLFTFVLFYQAQVNAERLAGGSRAGAADAGRVVSLPAGAPGADVLSLRGDPGLRRLLAAPAVACVRAGGGRCTRCIMRSGR